MSDYPRAKKSLGQHFLTNKHILEKIVSVGSVSAGDTVLEIGPGRGALTHILLEKGVNIVAVEMDEGLVKSLSREYEGYVLTEQLRLIEGDILTSRNALELATKEVSSYKVIANIPYYITGKILRFLFSLEKLPAMIVLLVQDEVALRATVLDGEKESLLSLSIKAFGTPRYRGKVKAGSFSPAPKVDSAILSIEDISRDYFNLFTEEAFFTIIKEAFSHKRKTLLNTLFRNDKVKGVGLLEGIDLRATVRPEELTLGQWKELIAKMKNTDD